jgi:hypothetical protein
MPSVKLQPDTLAILGGLRARFGAGHSYDKIIRELVRREIDSIANTILAGDRLERLEAMVTRILMRLEDAGTTTVPKKFTVE